MTTSAVALTVTADRSGQRLDAALHGMAPDLSRAAARELCAIGAIAIDGVRCQGPQVRVHTGEVLTWNQSTVELARALGMPVVHACDDVLVLHKPPGLAVHGGPLVTDSVAARLPAAFPEGGSGLAHRLDRGASGLLLVGRHAEALHSLAQAMEQGGIDRTYFAVVTGTPQRAFTVDLPLRVLDEPRGNRPKVIVDQEAGQPARSDVVLRDQRPDCALVQVTLHTGRTHQVRVHLQAAGHPLLGDPRYGDPRANEQARSTHGVQRVLLHATALAFTHPASGARLSFTAVHEPDFARLFPSLRQTG
jgi:RluA family pseudouridine synthase